MADGLGPGLGRHFLRIELWVDRQGYEATAEAEGGRATDVSEITGSSVFFCCFTSLDLEFVMIS